MASGNLTTPSLWPGVRLLLCDEMLDAVVPLTAVIDAPLSFEVEDGMILSRIQIEEIVEKACAQDGMASIGVTDTFGAVMELIARGYEKIPTGDTEEQQRLGRIIAIAAVFDDGVAAWGDHWHRVLGEMRGYLANHGGWTEHDTAHEAERALSADGVKEMFTALAGDVTLILQKLDASTEREVTGQLMHKVVLNLGESAFLLGMTPRTLHNRRLLHNMHDGPFEPHRLNGRKGPQDGDRWTFDRDEVVRFKDDVSAATRAGSGDEDSGVEVRGT